MTKEHSSAGSVPFGRRHRVALVDDHPAIRVGVIGIVGEMPDADLVAHASSVPELLALTRDLDLVLLDLRLSDGSTVTQNVVVLKSIGAEVLAYTSGESPTLVREAARAGTLGMLRKSEPPKVVTTAIRAALHGQVVASIDWAAALDGDPQLRNAKLSAREREVLGLYAAGAQADQVAAELVISRETVLDHIRRIRAKYSAVDRTAPTKIDLYRRAVEDGIFPDGS